MSPTSNWPRFIFPVTLLLAASSCTDEPFEDEETEFRGCPSTCGGGNFGNTNFVGVHSLANVSRIYGAVSSNSYTPDPLFPWFVQPSYNRILSTTCKLQGLVTTMGPWDADADGQLRFQYPGADPLNPTYLAGTDVLGCVFHMQFDHVDDFAFPDNVDVEIVQVTPVTRKDNGPGFNYVFTTPNNEYNNKVQFQPGKFVTCSKEGEFGGFRLVARPYLRLNWDAWAFWQDQDSVLFACESGADGHMIFQENVPVHTLVMPSRAQADLRMWGHWFNGAPRTIPGNRIDIRDQGGVDYSDGWGIEAKWGPLGAVCRGEFDRNFESRDQGWNDYDPGHTLPDCAGYTGPWDFETAAHCRRALPPATGIECVP